MQCNTTMIAVLRSHYESIRYAAVSLNDMWVPDGILEARQKWSAPRGFELKENNMVPSITKYVTELTTWLEKKAS